MSVTSALSSEVFTQRIVNIQVKATIKTKVAGMLNQRQEKIEPLGSRSAARIASRSFLVKCAGALYRNDPLSIAEANLWRSSPSPKQEAHPCICISTARLPDESSSPST